MHITVASEDGSQVYGPYELSGDAFVEDVQALLEVDSGVPLLEQDLQYNGAALSTTDRLSAAGVDGDAFIVMRRRARAPAADLGASLTQMLTSRLQDRRSASPAVQSLAPHSAARPSPAPPSSLRDALAQQFQLASSQLGQQQQQQLRIPEPLAFRDYVRSDPALLQQLLDTNSLLAEAVLSDDVALLRQVLIEQAAARAAGEREKLARAMRIQANPYSEESQREIASEIEAGLIRENMEMAIEHNPEAFASVCMLYINCEVNGHPIKAFVDSGAQSTIMSVACAERCNILKYLDRRWAGVAKGVGTARILGRVHVAPIRIGGSFFSSSFTILEECSIDLLFGLDMLKRHQCQIDLRANVLRIGDEEAPFLPEKDIPHSDLASSSPHRHSNQPSPDPPTQ